ncbi:MAG: cytochrome c biogenesis protein ResB [Spirochaetales bacterium]|nr:cytochrome c biogenesis protein ResB [Spirochaetales bacterium]
MIIKIFEFFRSMKLAIVLIVYMVISSIIATFIPQGLDLSYYLANYHHLVASLILLFQFNQFFYSPSFLIPAGLFFVNICCCSFYRVYYRYKNKLKKKFGPDLVHIGIILLLIGGLYSSFSREESLAFLDKGESYNLKRGYQIVLKDFSIENYEDGRVKKWISQLDIQRYGEFYKESRILVNQPASFGGYNIYQMSYRKTLNVLVIDSQGKELLLNEGGVLPLDDTIFMLSDIVIDEPTGLNHAVFDEFVNRKSTGRRFKVNIGESVANYHIKSADSDFVSGLGIVEDRSSPLILIAMIFVIIGLVLIYSREIIKGEVK